jgi:hypothetical protein
MAHRLMMSVFASVDAAQRARDGLLAAGIPDECIALSTDLTADDIAAEFPGQSFCNQPGRPDDTEPDHLCDAAHAGACVLRVDVATVSDGRPLEEIVRRCGARDTSYAD